MAPIPNVIIYYRVDANDQHLSAVSLAYQRAETAAALRHVKHVLAGEFIEEDASNSSHVAWRQAMKLADELGSALNCLLLIPVSAAFGSGKPFVIPEADRWKGITWNLELPVTPPREVIVLPRTYEQSLFLLRLQGAEGVRWHVYLGNGAQQDFFDVAVHIELFEFHPDRGSQVVSTSTKTYSRIAGGTGVLIGAESSELRSDVDVRYHVTARANGQDCLSREFIGEDMIEATRDCQHVG